MKRAIMVATALVVVAISGAALWVFAGGPGTTCSMHASGCDPAGEAQVTNTRSGKVLGHFDPAMVGCRVTGLWTGQFDLPSFGVEDYPVEVTLVGHEVTLQLSAAQIEFTGELNQASDVLMGVATTRGHRDSLVMRRAGQAELSEEFLRLESLSGDSSRVEYLSTTGAELRKQFNADRAHTRLVMLLSPT